MVSGLSVWRSAIRNIGGAWRSREGRRLRRRPSCGSFGCGSFGWGVAAEVMEPRALLSGPAYGQGFTSVTSAPSSGEGSVPNTMVTDTSGNVYLAGNYLGSLNISPTGSYVLNNSTGNSAQFLAKYSSSPSLSLQWAVAPFQNAGSNLTVFSVASLTAGPVSGDLYACGVFKGTLQLTTVQGTTLTVTSPSAGSGYLMRLDHNTGNVVWFAETGGGSIVTDSAENVYLAGQGGGTTSYQYIYGPGTGGAPVSITGSGEVFLKIDSNGNVLWSGQTPGISAGPPWQVKPISVDASGNLYFTGGLTGTGDADPSSGVKTLTAIGTEDSIVEKISTNGQLVWVVQNGYSGQSNYGRGIVVDANGNVDVNFALSYIVSVTVTGKGKNKTTTFVTGNLVQFNNNGSMNWYTTVPGSGADAFFKGNMAVDSAGNIYAPSFVTNTAMYLSKYSSNGTLDWTATNAYSSAYPTSFMNNLAIDGSGNIWWSGNVWNGGQTTGQINVSPTSTPVYLQGAPFFSSDGVFGMVEWTQPGGFASVAGKSQAAGIAGGGQATVNTATAPTTAAPAPQTIYVGDTTPAPSPAPSADVHDTDLAALLI